MRRLLIVAIALLALGARYVVEPQPPPGTCHARGRGAFTLPDSRCTPGAIARVNVARICRAGYSRMVRPPEAVTAPEKRASMRAYGDHGSARGYEYDHLIPLELGGAPNDPRNLWPEPGSTPNLKDTLENTLHRRVCDGTLGLRAAQRLIAGDWVAVYDRLVASRS